MSQDLFGGADVLTRPGLTGPRPDSPPPGTRVHVRETHPTWGSVRTRRGPMKAREGLRSWWVWTSRPASLRATWRQSRLDTARIPARSRGLRRLWLLSNGTDRLVWTAVVLVVPTFLSGPARWLMARPTRRWAFYVCGGAAALLLLNR